MYVGGAYSEGRGVSGAYFKLRVVQLIMIMLSDAKLLHNAT